MEITTMEITTLIIAIISILIASVTLYFNYIKPAKIKVLIGNKIKIYYTDYRGEMHGTGFYLPIDFVNTSNRTGTVIKTSILFHKKNQSSERFLIQQNSFSKYDSDNNKWIFDEMAHSIVLSAKTSVNKIIWYLWKNNSSPKIEFSKGEYQIRIMYWLNAKKKPKHIKFDFHIDDNMEVSLKDDMEKKSSLVTDVIINKEFDENRCMTEMEEKKIFL